MIYERLCRLADTNGNGNVTRGIPAVLSWDTEIFAQGSFHFTQGNKTTSWVRPATEVLMGECLRQYNAILGHGDKHKQGPLTSSFQLQVFAAAQIEAKTWSSALHPHAADFAFERQPLFGTNNPRPLARIKNLPAKIQNSSKLVHLTQSCKQLV